MDVIYTIFLAFINIIVVFFLSIIFYYFILIVKQTEIRVGETNLKADETKQRSENETRIESSNRLFPAVHNRHDQMVQVKKKIWEIFSLYSKHQSSPKKLFITRIFFR